MWGNTRSDNKLRPVTHSGRRAKAWFPVVLLLTLLLPDTAYSQDEAPDSPPLPEAPADAVGPAEPTDGAEVDDASDDAADSVSTWDRLIYLPYRNLKDALNRHGSTVFLPYSEYLKRWRDTAPEVQNLGGVITESHYRGRVDQSLLRLEAELTIQVLGKPWVEVPLRFGGAAVGTLTSSDDQQVLLRGTGDETYSLLFGQTGEHVVHLELAVPISTSPDGQSVSFTVPPVGITTFELSIPESDQTVALKPRLVSLPVDAADGETRIRANLGSTTSIAASWHAKTGLKPDMDLIAAVTNHQQVSLRDGLAHTDAWLTYDILRGEMTSVAIAVPASHRILGVSSDNAKIRSWKAQPGESVQTLTVDFLAPVRNSVTIEIHSEREFTDEPFALAGRDGDGTYHGIHAIDAVREAGQIAVVAASDLSLQIEQLTGLARIESSEVAERLRRDGAPTFKFYSADINLIVSARPIEPRLTVASDCRIELTEAELKLRSNLNYTVERAGVFELRVAVPDGLTIDSVSDSAGLYREHHLETGDETVLRIVFGQKSAPSQQFTVTVLAHSGLDDDVSQLDLVLPIPQPLNVDRETGRVTVTATDGIDIITRQDTVVGAQPAPVDISGAGGPFDSSQSIVAWTFNRRPLEIPITTERRPTRLTAQVGTTVHVREDLTEVQTQLTYEVQFAGLDTFRFAVPETVSADVQVVSLEGDAAPAIKQSIPDDEPVDGWVTWTVTMQRPVKGTHRFQVTWDLKPETLPASADDGASDTDDSSGSPTDDAASASSPAPSELVMQTLRVLGLDGTGGEPEVALTNVSGEIAVQKDRALAVETSPLDSSLEAIDIRELTLLPVGGAVAYRYFRQPVGLKITVAKHDIQKVVETVVSRGLVEIVTRSDTRANYRCRYRIRSSERQRLRVDIPVGSELLGVFIDGQAVNPERNAQPLEVPDWDSYFINVSRSSASDAPFSLTLQMMTPIAESAPFVESWGGRLLLRLPQIGGYDNSSIAVQQVNTVLWVPDEFRLVGHADGFTHETQPRLESALQLNQRLGTGHDPLDIESWINVPRAGFIDFPTEGNRYRYSSLGGAPSITVRFVNHRNYTWLCSGSLLIIAVLLRSLSWDMKVLLLLIAGFTAVLSGLTAPAWTAEMLSTSRFGLYGLLGVWILHLLFNWRDNASDSPAAPPRTEPPSFQPVVAAVIPPPGVFDDLRDQFGQ